MSLAQVAMKDACGPCLTEKQIKKRNEEEAKDLKATINYLAKNFGYDHEGSKILGQLIQKLYHLQGPLK